MTELAAETRSESPDVSRKAIVLGGRVLLFLLLLLGAALPAETREYVPKVFAAIIIGRNPDRFGFLVSRSAP